MNRSAAVVFSAFAVLGVLLAHAAPAIQQVADGVVIRVGDGSLELQVCADDVIRVAYAKDPAFFARKSVVVAPVPPGKRPQWTLTSDANRATLATARLKARVDLATGNVTFLDAAGATILAEKSRTITPAEVQGEKTQHIRQQWQASPDESLYGLGQHQIGTLDIKGFDLDLWQRNTTVVVPFFVSSRGYGVLWDNLSFTRFGDLRTFDPVPAEYLFDSTGKSGGLTTGTFAPANPEQLQDSTTAAVIVRDRAARAGGGRGGQQGTMRWVGEILAPTGGEYQFQTYSNGGIKVWIDNKLLIDRWRQGWLTEYDQVKLRLDAGRRYAIRIESGGEQATTMQFRWKTPAASPDTSLWSEVADGVDYYFVYGPELDKVVAGYRKVTGAASLLPRWAFGLWQSRQRYENAQQLLDAVDGFRSRKIPFDNIVQDWMYWREDAWGSHQFDPARFPDPVGWIKQIHDRHAQLMISVWGKFYPGTDNFNALQKAGYIYQATLDAGLKDWVGRGYAYTFYDPFSPGARKMFWDQLNSALFSKGVDAWWMDASEPDVVQPSPPTLELTKKYIGQTAVGSSSRVLNGYALMNAQGIYEGQRSVSPNQRVFLLTRSGFAGQQRYATVTWSGDITSTWTTMAAQIPAALGFSISGIPYWTMDAGGYTMESRFSSRNQTPENAEEWRELNARWFQFATFCPILRVHGELQPREMWTMGGESHPAYQTQLKFDRLRYAMLPYIYSVAGNVTLNGGTMMRPFVMDFPADARARELTDEYMFGPAFLAAPVTTFKARSRQVYLPEASGWYDFWTGAAAAPGRSLEAAAPYDSMPLYVKAGSIVPFGPELQYTSEKPADPITLRVYSGADGSFTLYEDEGVNYDYEKGAFAKIPIRWNDATKTLTIGKREGAFPGMLTNRTFTVIVVSKAKPVGFAFEPQADRTVRYSGEAVNVRMR